MNVTQVAQLYTFNAYSEFICYITNSMEKLHGQFKNRSKKKPTGQDNESKSSLARSRSLTSKIIDTSLKGILSHTKLQCIEPVFE